MLARIDIKHQRWPDYTDGRLVRQYAHRLFYRSRFFEKHWLYQLRHRCCGKANHETEH